MQGGLRKAVLRVTGRLNNLGEESGDVAVVACQDNAVSEVSVFLGRACGQATCGDDCGVRG